MVDLESVAASAPPFSQYFRALHAFTTQTYSVTAARQAHNLEEAVFESPAIYQKDVCYRGSTESGLGYARVRTL